MQALNLVDKSGPNDLTSLLDKESTGKLASLPDILGQIVKVGQTQNMDLLPSSISCQKAAVTTFQTWSMRNDGESQVGILLGEACKNKGWKSYYLIVGSSFDTLLSHSSVAILRDQEKLQPIGVVAAMLETDRTRWRETFLESCGPLIGEKCQKALCILAPCLVVVHTFPYRCIHAHMQDQAEMF